MTRARPVRSRMQPRPDTKRSVTIAGPQPQDSGERDQGGNCLLATPPTCSLRSVVSGIDVLRRRGARSPLYWSRLPASFLASLGRIGLDVPGAPPIARG